MNVHEFKAMQDRIGESKYSVPRHEDTNAKNVLSQNAKIKSSIHMMKNLDNDIVELDSRIHELQFHIDHIEELIYELVRLEEELKTRDHSQST